MPRGSHAHLQKPSRVAVIGTGLVGSTYAYTLLVEGTADEIVLIDINREKALGDAMDLNHAVPFAKPTEIWAGTMNDVKEADVIVVAAGAAQKPGETRMDLLERNADIVGHIAEEAGRLAPGAVLLVVTNPVDVMSYVAWVRSGFPPERVLGSGTILDTARLRYVLGEDLGIDPRSIHATVLGEHGDTELVAWSRAQIAGTNLLEWPELTKERREDIFAEVRDAAYHIINLKGATYYAIALALARLTETILKDLRTVYSVSAYLRGEYGIHGIYLGIPCVVGREGVVKTIELPLSKEELEALLISERAVRRAIESLGLREPASRQMGLLATAGHEIAEELFDTPDFAPGSLKVRGLRNTRRPTPISEIIRRRSRTKALQR
ncbi:MAG TPA: L-lactate dehydrogenase [Firmicutes bacterium]|nr:L-lactate dehydrogenase [Candidatus Fermentithermobacillaceae bacterium]